MTETQPTPAEETFSRAQRFAAGKLPTRRLADMAVPCSFEAVDENPFAGWDRAALVAEVLRRPNWRYHHDLPELQASAELYTAYAKRVDTLLAMLDNALEAEGVLEDLGHLTACDLACAEGFVAMRYLQRGLPGIDAFELNRDQIERAQMMAELKAVRNLHLHRIDLESFTWCQTLGRSYDLVFCLGVVYHLENPMLFLRNVYEITEDVCLVESDTPLICPNAPVLAQQDSQVTLETGAVRYLLEARPNRRSLIDMLLAVGFESVRVVPPPDNARCPYLASGRKTLLVAKR